MADRWALLGGSLRFPHRRQRSHSGEQKCGVVSKRAPPVPRGCSVSPQDNFSSASLCRAAPETLAEVNIHQPNC